MKQMKLIADDITKPTTVKDFLKRRGFSVTLIKQVKYGGIMLRGEVVTVRATVYPYDELTVSLPHRTSEGIEPMDIPVKVIYEDEYILAVDKPTNMPTHPSKGNSLPTLANAVMGMYGGNFVFRSVNRLDRDTSGIVLIAKDQMTSNLLSAEMKAGKFGKKYMCIVEGVPSPREGRIEAPIERECEGSIKRIVRPDGKYALTEYKVCEVLGDASLLEVKLHTGRTHQIRVHMAYIGCPLRGDYLYGERRGEEDFLRCTELSFPHPYTGEDIVLRA